MAGNGAVSGRAPHPHAVAQQEAGGDGAEAGDGRAAAIYYDVAQIAHPVPLAALAKFVPASQILWGTDYPFRFGNEYVKALAAFGFSDSDLARSIVRTRSRCRAWRAG